MRIEAVVTQEMIDKGVRSDASCCPIALALLAAVPRATYLGVGSDYFHFEIGRTRYDGDLAAEALQFREEFDLGKPVKPQTFILEAE